MINNLLVTILALTACSEAKVSGPTTADVLRAESEFASGLRSVGKFAYPEPEKADLNEQPVAIADLKCKNGDCTYDLAVASSTGRRTIHRPSVHFCRDSQNAWVQCVS